MYPIFKLKILAMVFGLCFFTQLAVGQEKLRSYTVGEKVPDILITQVMNDTDSTFRISDFKDKLLIIDFWGTTCSSCIEALPKLDSLQQANQEKVKIFTVTNFEKAERVKATLQRYPKTRGMKLPVVLNGGNLKQMFPHEIVSHVVWIGGDGIIKAITGTEYVTASNIAAVLKGEPVAWPIKRDWIGFDYAAPMIDWTARHRPAWVYHSGFSGNLAGVDAKNTVRVDSVRDTRSYNYFNGELTQFAAASVTGRMMGPENPKDVVLEVKDPGRFFWDPALKTRTDWEVGNTFCYAFTVPASLSKEAQRLFIRQDLTHWLALLGIQARKEKRMVKCLVIKSGLDAAKLLYARGLKEKDVFEAKKGIFEVHHSGFSVLKDFLNYEVPGIPKVFDESGIDAKFKMDMKLKFIPGDVASILEGLKAYGLTIVEEMREREMYVIAEQGRAD